MILLHSESFSSTISINAKSRFGSNKVNDNKKIPLSFRNPTKLYSEKETLIFSFQTSVVSDKLPTNDINEIRTFIRSKECRNHFLSGGGKTVIREEEFTENLEKMWIESSDKWYGNESIPSIENKDKIVASETAINFPGMKLTNTVFSGVKILEDEKCNPYYKCFLVADKKIPTGAKPVVWLYYKLTGGESKLDYNPPAGNAVSTICITEVDDNGYALKFSCNLQIIIEFPKVLMKILPSSKEKIEEQGSESVRKAVEKDIMSSISTTNDSFENWKVNSLMYV